MKPESVININPKILSGTPVFKGTRVRVETLFDHLESGITIHEILEGFPSVTKDQVIAILEIAGKFFSAKHIKKIYETAA